MTRWCLFDEENESVRSEVKARYDLTDQQMDDMRKRFDELQKTFGSIEEPKCSKCGRVILCGAQDLCKEKECGLK